MINFYSIRSRSSGLFDRPFPCENDKRVVYELKALINSDRESIISQFPEDHELFRVAYFDEEHGKMKAQNDCLIKDLSVLKRKEVK